MRDRLTNIGDGLAIAAALIVGVTTALYVTIMVSQEERLVSPRTGFVVVLLGVALAAVIGSMTFGDPATRRAAAAGAAGLLLCLGTLSLLSVGLLLLIAGVLMVVWLTRTQDQRPATGRPWVTVVAAVVGAALPLMLLIAA